MTSGEEGVYLLSLVQDTWFLLPDFGHAACRIAPVFRTFKVVVDTTPLTCGRSFTHYNNFRQSDRFRNGGGIVTAVMRMSHDNATMHTVQAGDSVSFAQLVVKEKLHSSSLESVMILHHGNLRIVWLLKTTFHQIQLTLSTGIYLMCQLIGYLNGAQTSLLCCCV